MKFIVLTLLLSLAAQAFVSSAYNKWGKTRNSSGLTGVQVLRGLSAGDGSAAPYVAMAHLTFRDAEALAASMSGPNAPGVLVDIVNFTDIAPIAQVSAPV